MRYLIFFAFFIISCDLDSKKDETISLNIISNPSGAQIHFDNINTGHTTPHLFENMEESILVVKLILNSDYPEYNQTV